jgi:hypothetical protein
MSKTLVWIGVFAGSALGGYVPSLFGAEMFSMWGLLGSTVGGIAGVFAGLKLGDSLGI